jgi:hypothetical protein
MLQLRLMEKRSELVPKAVYDAMIDQVRWPRADAPVRSGGPVLARHGGPAKIDAMVYEVRKEMAKVALEMADKKKRAAPGTAGRRLRRPAFSVRVSHHQRRW